MTHHTTDIQAFIGQLYESENLTEALTDDAAQILLAWGEQELKNIDRFAPGWIDDDVFRDLRRIIRTINRIIEQKDDLSEAELVQLLLRLIERVVQLTLKIPSGEMVEPALYQPHQGLPKDDKKENI